MLYDYLLGLNWSKVPHRDRDEALRRARAAGVRAAEEALTGGGGPPLLDELRPEDLRNHFFEFLVGDDQFWKKLDGYDQDYWEQLSMHDDLSDPRIEPFCDGWLSFMIKELTRQSPSFAEEVDGLSVQEAHKLWLAKFSPKEGSESKTNGRNGTQSWEPKEKKPCVSDPIAVEELYSRFRSSGRTNDDV